MVPRHPVESGRLEGQLLPQVMTCGDCRFLDPATLASGVRYCGRTLTWQWHTSQGCPDGVQTLAKPDIETVYMEPRALAFLRAWPDVPQALHAVWDRLWAAGVLWTDPNAGDEWDASPAKFPFSLRLTSAGEALKTLIDGQSYNMFLRTDVVGIVELIDVDFRGADVFGNPTGLTPEQEFMRRHIDFRSLWKDEIGTYAANFTGRPPTGMSGSLAGLKSALIQNKAAQERLAKALKNRKLV